VQLLGDRGLEIAELALLILRQKVASGRPRLKMRDSRRDTNVNEHKRSLRKGQVGKHAVLCRVGCAADQDL
jgi:hypothetical protein